MRQDQNIIKDMQDKMAPVTLLTEINKSTAEKLIAIQTEYMTDLFNTGIAQMKALSGVHEPKEAFELQIKYFKELDAKLVNVAEKEVAALSETKEQLLDVVEKNLSEMTNMSDIYGLTEVSKFMQNVQKKNGEMKDILIPEKSDTKPATSRKTS